MKPDLSRCRIADFHLLNQLVVKACIVGLMVVVSHASGDGKELEDSSADHHMKVLGTRVIDGPDGDIKLSFYVGTKFSLAGSNRGNSGCFYELRVTSKSGAETSERTVWREFVDKDAYPQGEEFCDMLLVPKTDEIYLAVGHDDYFGGLIIVPRTATPRLALPKLPLSPEDSDNIFRVPITEGERSCWFAQLPDEIRYQAKSVFALPVFRLHLENKGDDIVVCVTVQRKNPVAFLYSIATKTWRLRNDNMAHSVKNWFP